jgi:integrase
MLKTDVQVRNWRPTKPGERVRCGDGLYLRGSEHLFEARILKNWIPLGKHPDQSLEQARAMVPVCKRLLKSGAVAVDDLKAAASRTVMAHELEDILTKAANNQLPLTGMITFDQAFRDWYHENLQANTWKHPASVRRPLSQYERHAMARIGGMRLDHIGSAVLHDLLQPLILSHKDTGHDLRNYIWSVFERALTKEIIKVNPCPSIKSFTQKQWKLKTAPRIHHSKLPELWNWIGAQRFSVPVSVAMKLTMVTCHRAAVVANMRRDHYDPTSGVWAVPEKDIEAGLMGFMKSGRAFAVQLPIALNELIEPLASRPDSCEYMFSVDGQKPMHPETLRKNFRKFGAMTTHGLRATFKIWALEQDVDPFLADRFLDHGFKGLDRSYRNDTMFKKRAELMGRYAAYIAGEGNV